MKENKTYYEVVVTGEPLQTFDNVVAAIDYAARHVYLPVDKGHTCCKALNEGRPYSYSYGFKEVDLTPKARAEGERKV
jgi:hypothetical protein